jgi:replication-associated recombination protein RarA
MVHAADPAQAAAAVAAVQAATRIGEPVERPDLVQGVICA